MITLPENKRGRKSQEDTDLHDSEVVTFCEAIKKINSSLDFKVSSRGWCYLLEEYGLNKGDFDKAQELINKCRKSGLLPLDICAEDVARSSEGVDKIDDINPGRYAKRLVNYVRNDLAGNYRPLYFSDYQDYYIEVLLEKIDLKGIFGPVCDKYKIPYKNARGWSDINGRADIMRRFKERESDGKICVLLYCGDHDPGGLQISDFIMTNFIELRDAVDWSPQDLIIDRFGLNYDFIIENGLTWIDNLETGSGGEIAVVKSDGTFGPGKTKNGKEHPDFLKSYVQNYLKEYGVRKVEANALVTRVEAGRRLCEDAILKYIDLDGVDRYNKDTADARKRLQIEITKQFKS
jgi:hypothetical protein